MPAACALNGSLLLGRELTIATSTPLTKAEGQQQYERHGDGDGRQQQRRERQQRGQQQQQPEPGKPVGGCWFCLSSDQVRLGGLGGGPHSWLWVLQGAGFVDVTGWSSGLIAPC